ncbi:hypothetical protein F3Y22_tig00110814pilonHSYRG00162 [Hibiscus syriacus]|uniref:Uncharacterized protein n=1 Tax=Hibiscus syriacus TaxID=106335 RepID=A0A6A2ZNG1_HIBSY|nr:hypothetical protein F3Y22_tig00110814pilonHSYRG00162 [Hibiscus syriacus]
MSGITVDASNLEDLVDQHPILSDFLPQNLGGNSRYDQRFLAMVSPINRAFINHVVDGCSLSAILLAL